VVRTPSSRRRVATSGAADSGAYSTSDITTTSTGGQGLPYYARHAMGCNVTQENEGSGSEG
jgi:hypothetical protein